MRSNLNERQLDYLCLRWADWCRTRRLFGAPRVPAGVLARMRPGKVRPAPDAVLSADLSIFNTAVNAQDETPAKIAFVIFYLYPARNVKEAAAAMDVTPNGFYKRVSRFRRRVYRTALALETATATTGQEHSGSGLRLAKPSDWLDSVAPAIP